MCDNRGGPVLTSTSFVRTIRIQRGYKISPSKVPSILLILGNHCLLFSVLCVRVICTCVYTCVFALYTFLCFFPLKKKKKKTHISIFPFLVLWEWRTCFSSQVKASLSFSALFSSLLYFKISDITEKTMLIHLLLLENIIGIPHLSPYRHHGQQTCISHWTLTISLFCSFWCLSLMKWLLIPKGWGKWQEEAAL